MKKNNTFRFCLAQINTTVGDIRGNCAKIGARIKAAEEKSVDVIIFPEMAVTGYPPEDLLLKKRFVNDNIEAMKNLAAQTGSITAITGFINKKEGKIFNSAAVISNGRLLAVYDKLELPNYGVFDEKRYFEAGKIPLIINAGGARIGLSICEDIWQDNKQLNSLKGKIDFLINISASPYHMQKWKERYDIFKQKAKLLKTEIIYVNAIGGQDELVFDGHSTVIGRNGKMLYQACQFEEEELIIDRPFKAGKAVRGMINTAVQLKVKEKKADPEKHTTLSKYEEIYSAIVLGTKDYVQKNGFQKAVIGLSGGIDSALVACIASDALGTGNVTLIYMPTQYSSKASHDDALKLAENLGIKLKIISIQKIFEMYLKILAPFFAGTLRDIAEENLQARIRGNIIMAFSNKFGAMALTTGNKSEMSTGYATLYGDMAGGFAVIKDVPKTIVYKLAEARNTKAGSELIPQNILTKAPTAELRENQKDTDSLPEYPLLDSIIEDYIEKDRTYFDMKGRYDDALLRKTIKLIDVNEYKRRQSPPGVKITPKAFGRDRRMPITNKYRD